MLVSKKKQVGIFCKKANLAVIDVTEVVVLGGGLAKLLADVVILGAEE